VGRAEEAAATARREVPGFRAIGSTRVVNGMAVTRLGGGSPRKVTPQELAAQLGVRPDAVALESPPG
jgi:hypothetical protein